MGCAFNSFGRSWGERSYILALIVFCWLLPTINNVASYIIMVKRLKKSDMKFYVLNQNTETPRCRRTSKIFNIKKTVNIYFKNHFRSMN